jgi:hypothetical protein
MDSKLLLAAAFGMVVAISGGVKLAAAETSPDCIEVTTRTQATGVGYNHLVQVKNGCDSAMHCHVTTSANAKGVHLNVDKGKTKEITTFLSSPASTFTAEAKCQPSK